MMHLGEVELVRARAERKRLDAGEVQSTKIAGKCKGVNAKSQRNSPAAGSGRAVVFLG
jgi:hypothetical protein